VTAYTMDANEAQEEYEEVQTELRKKEEEVSSNVLGLTVIIQGGTERNTSFDLFVCTYQYRSSVIQKVHKVHCVSKSVPLCHSL